MTNVAIVTGGSRGIGRATALKLAAAGYTVVVNYAANEAAANEVVQSIMATGGKAVAVKGDVASESDVLALFAAADKLGPSRSSSTMPASWTARNAGRDGPGPPQAHVRHQHPRLLPLRARSGEEDVDEAWGSGGVIVNQSSAAAVLGAPALGVEYAASKGAIDVLTIGLGREVAAEGIRVNAVRPGIIDTEIHDSSGIPGRVKMMREVIPMKREGKAEEVADAIMWLCSDQSSYVTGTIIPVAGGRC